MATVEVVFSGKSNAQAVLARVDRIESLGHALDRACGCYRKALREILDECSHDRPRTDQIAEHAQRGIDAATYELEEAVKALAT